MVNRKINGKGECRLQVGYTQVCIFLTTLKDTQGRNGWFAHQRTHKKWNSQYSIMHGERDNKKIWIFHSRLGEFSVEIPQKTITLQDSTTQS